MNLKKIIKGLNEHVATDVYGKTLRVELTCFDTGHRVNRGRNGTSTLLDLRTTIIEARSLMIETHARSSLLTVYLYAPVQEAQSSEVGRSEGVFVKICDKKGRYRTISLFNWRNEDESTSTLMSLLEYPDLSAAFPEQFTDFKEGRSTQGQRKVFLLTEDGEEDAQFNEDELRRLFTQDLISSVAYPLSRGDTERFEKILTALGSKLVSHYIFTDRMSIVPQFVRETKRGLEIGWMTSSTYNSLPVVLKVEKSKGIKTIGLADIGVEERGYYSHDDRMQVLPSQAKAAREFARSFKAKKGRRVEAALAKAAA